MTTPNPSDNDSLYRFLKDEIPANDPDLDGQDIRAASTLKAAAQDIQPDPKFQADLEQRLLTAARNSFQPSPRRPGAVRLLPWAALAALLLGLSWAIQNLLPVKVLPAVAPSLTPSAGLAGSPVPTETAAFATPTEGAPFVQPTSTPLAPAYTSPFFPGTRVLLRAAFPTAPQEVGIYAQQTPEPLTIAAAKETAARLGIEGEVYLGASEASGATIYIVTDGIQRVIFLNSTQRYSYYTDQSKPFWQTNNMPGEERQAVVKTFLGSHALLAEPFRVEIPSNNAGSVKVYPLLEGIPLQHSLYDTPPMQLEVNQDGQVTYLDYALPGYQAVGNFPILGAEAAWKRILSSDTTNGWDYSLAYDTPRVQSWTRSYQPGESVNLYGYLEMLQPAEAGVDPLAMLNNYPLTGDLQSLVNASNPRKFLQLTGEFQPRHSGGQEFVVQSWQISPYPDDSLDGVIQRQGDQVSLKAGERVLSLLDIPDEIPDGSPAQIRGVVLGSDQPVLDWSWINIGDGGGGGGGGGNGFAGLNLSADPASALTPPPTPTPLAHTGQRLEGVEGTLYASILLQAGGSQQYQYEMYLAPDANFPDGISVRLEGPGAAGIESLHQLPVRIWGEVVSAEGLIPHVSVERYEAVYPDVSLQVWLGTQQLVTLEGKQVIRFTAQDGSQYILRGSIQWGAGTLVGEAGDRAIVEGAVYPGQTFAGLPVITEISMSIANDRTDLRDYEPTSIKPGVVDAVGESSGPAEVTIDHIELVYFTPDTRGILLAPDGPPIYIQPVWRFTGADNSGASFTLLIQALPDYLLVR